MGIGGGAGEVSATGLRVVVRMYVIFAVSHARVAGESLGMGHTEVRFYGTTVCCFVPAP